MSLQYVFITYSEKNTITHFLFFFFPQKAQEEFPKVSYDGLTT